MVSPVVFVTVGALLTNGLIATTNQMSQRLEALNGERLRILTGSHGELLTENQLPPVERSRLAVINNLEPLVLGRIRWVRNACMLMYIAIGILVLGVILLAAGVPSHTEPLLFVALGLVVAGVVVEFAGIAIVVAVLAKATNALTYETSHTDALESGQTTSAHLSTAASMAAASETNLPRGVLRLGRGELLAVGAASGGALPAARGWDYRAAPHDPDFAVREAWRRKCATERPRRDHEVN